MTDERQPDPADKNEAITTSSSNSDGADAERRAILAGLGKLAALTPPTVVMLMLSTRPSAASP